jgi:hypothetical protein
MRSKNMIAQTVSGMRNHVFISSHLITRQKTPHVREKLF